MFFNKAKMSVLLLIVLTLPLLDTIVDIACGENDLFREELAMLALGCLNYW
jgi:hypothetical protein